MTRAWCDLARRVSQALLIAVIAAAAPARAQSPDPDTRAGTIEQAQAEKAAALSTYVPNKAEKYLNYAETYLTTGSGFHPYFESAYSGGGFTMGAGYLGFLTGYATVDIRGSYTPKGYTRIEGELFAPRLLHRQGTLSVVAGWREATQVGFYGVGTTTTTANRAAYGFKQPYARTQFTFRPANGIVLLRGGVEESEWRQTPGSGNDPSVETVYTPDTLPGLGASVVYLHTEATVALDSRASPGYARRGGFYGVTLHDYWDHAGLYGFTQTDYDAIQHVPLLRDTWVLSLHARVSTTGTSGGEQVPFFMLPSVGGGSSLRAYSSWRFRDRNSLELQAEWRVLVNRMVDTAIFYDAGKVAAHPSDLNLDGLRNDYGVGFRLHGRLATPLRIDVAHGNEGLSVVFAADAIF